MNPSEGAHPPPTRVPLAAFLLLAVGLLVTGCPGGKREEAPAGPGGTPRDPAVEAVLAKRPYLARNRVFVLGMDGCDLRLVMQGVDAGRLPNFKRLIEEGAFGPLRSFQPTLSPLLWTTVATGKWPTEHGVLDFMVRDDSDPKKRTTVGSRNRQVEAMWDIAGRYGRTVGVVGWLASHPAEKVNGFAVSERTEQLAYLYNQKIPPSDEGKTWPPGLMEEIRSLRLPASSVTREDLSAFLDVSKEEFEAACTKEEFSDANRVNNLRLILNAGGNFRRVGLDLWKKRRPDLFCIYFEELDAVSHNFMCFREPVTWKPREADDILRLLPDADPDLVRAVVARVRGEDPGAPPIVVGKDRARSLDQIVEFARGADPAKVEKWGRAVDAAYEDADRLLGAVMAVLDDRTTLLVLSDHGFSSGEEKPGFDSSFTSRMGGASYHVIDGVLGAWGHGVSPGVRIPPVRRRVDETRGARLLDICPTVLALLGLPRGADMPGRVLSELFTLDLPDEEIPTYEGDRAVRLARERAERESRRRLSGGDPTEDAEVEESMRQLIAVGYVGTEEEGPVRVLLNMARCYLEQSRLEEAEEAFTEALKSARGQARLSCLYNLGLLRRQAGDVEGAEKRFGEALVERPDFIPALHGMIGILESRGDRDGVVTTWERIVGLAPENPAYRVRLAEALRQAAAGRPGPEKAEILRKAESLILDTVRPEGGGDPDLEKLGPSGRNFLGMIQLEAGRHDDALTSFRAAAAQSEEYVRPRNNLGVAFMRLADRDLQAALAMKERGEEQRARAFYQASLGEREEALRWFDEVLAIDGDNAKARFNRGEIYVRLEPQDLPASERELTLALEANPDYRRARELLDLVKKALGRPEGGEATPPDKE